MQREVSQEMRLIAVAIIIVTFALQFSIFRGVVPWIVLGAFVAAGVVFLLGPRSKSPPGDSSL